MRVPGRDLVATAIVATAVVLYVLWIVDVGLPGLDGVRAIGAVLLGLGFAASVVAVVPGFDELLHGNKAYLGVTSALGLLAFAGGLLVLITASSTGLALMMSAMVVLWAVATTHHVLSRRSHETHLRLAA